MSIILFLKTKERGKDKNIKTLKKNKKYIYIKNLTILAGKNFVLLN